MFGVLPTHLKRIPLSEFRILRRYYEKVREQLEDGPSRDSFDTGPEDGVVVG